MSNLSDQLRMSPADQWAEQQIRDRQRAETAAIIAANVYFYETGTYEDRVRMRKGWAILPTLFVGGGVCEIIFRLSLHDVMGVDPDSGEHIVGGVSSWFVAALALIGLVVYRLSCCPPAPRDNDRRRVGDEGPMKVIRLASWLSLGAFLNAHIIDHPDVTESGSSLDVLGVPADLAHLYATYLNTAPVVAGIITGVLFLLSLSSFHSHSANVKGASQ
jgi:hypothetical protein